MAKPPNINQRGKKFCFLLWPHEDKGFIKRKWQAKFPNYMDVKERHRDKVYPATSNWKRECLGKNLKDSKGPLNTTTVLPWLAFILQVTAAGIALALAR